MATQQKAATTREPNGNALMNWVDERLPVRAFFRNHLSHYYAPRNFNFWYFFGSLALLALVMQIVTGIFLTMHYKPDAELAFASVEYIMRDVDWGWLIRYMHSTGASAFFVVVYLHMFRALLYGSYKKPRELLWIFGVLLYLVLMAEAFMGYLLPWGQMSYWGAQVIVNLFGAIPYIGPDIALWIRGDYVISDATLNRFFAFHVIALPMALLALSFLHLAALHTVGSNNPEGIEIKNHKDRDGVPLDGIPFHPYYTVKDIVGVAVFLTLFSFVVFFAPEGGGYFLEPANFIPANPLLTPEHIAPLWYFTPFYTILRAIPDPWYGVMAMSLAIMVLFFMPWIDTNPIKSIRYRSFLHRFNLMALVVVFFILGYLGMQPVLPPLAELAVRFSEAYFLFYVFLAVYSRQRSNKTYFSLFFLILALITFYDYTRMTEDTVHLVLMGWAIPALYLLIMLIVPVYTTLDEDRPVPDRITP